MITVKSAVMTMAWQIWREEKLKEVPTIENPMKEAWKRVKRTFAILNDLKSNTTIFAEAYAKATAYRKLCKAFQEAEENGMSVKFSYLAAKNRFRPAIGNSPTQERAPRKVTDKPVGKKSYSANGTYFDQVKQKIRTFKIENLIIEKIEFVEYVQQ